MIFVGVDWAEAHHDVFVQNEDGKRLGGGRLPGGVEGITNVDQGVGRADLSRSHQWRAP
jgi:hypothetical protein